MIRLSWLSTDKQCSLPMGEYATQEAALAAIPSAKAALLGQYTDEAGQHRIEAGVWKLEWSEGAL